MKRFPIKPGTAVHLPHRPDETAKKPQPTKKAPSLQEQNRQLRKRLKRLRLALIGAVLLLAVSVTALVYALQTPADDADNIGQNYSTMDLRRYD